MVGFGLHDTNSWWRFLGLLFLLFSFKKVHEPLPNFIFTAGYRNRVGPTLFPKMRLSLQAVVMWMYAKSFVLMENLCHPLFFLALIFLKLSSHHCLLTARGRRPEPCLLQIPLICILFVCQNIRCTIQMDHILRTADWWCLPILPSFRGTKFRLLWLRGSPCNISESIPEEYQAAPQLAVCSHIRCFGQRSTYPYIFLGAHFLIFRTASFRVFDIFYLRA